MCVIGVDFRFGLLLWFLFQVCAIGLQFGFLVRVSGLGLRFGSVVCVSGCVSGLVFCGVGGGWFGSVRVFKFGFLVWVSGWDGLALLLACCCVLSLAFLVRSCLGSFLGF